MPPDIAAALRADDPTWNDFCRRTTPERFIRALYNLRRNLDLASEPAYRRSLDRSRAARERLCDCVGQVHGLTRFVERVRAFAALPLDRAREAAARDSVLMYIWSDHDLAGDERLRILEDQLRRSEAFGPPMAATTEKSLIGSEALRHGDTDAFLASRSEVLEEALQEGLIPTACQALGEMGVMYGQLGDRDAQRSCYVRALDLATQYRLAEQAARLYSFIASFYSSEGRLGVAEELRRQAEDVCLEYGGEQIAIRFSLERMDFYARLGCWDLVSQRLRHADVLLRRNQEGIPPSEDPGVYARRLEILRARVALRSGEVEEAEKVFSREADELRRLGARNADYPGLLVNWGDGMLDGGRPRRALELGEQAFAYSRERNLPEFDERSLLLAARARLELGDPRGAAAELDSLDACRITPSRRTLCDCRVLRYRIALDLRAGEPGLAGDRRPGAARTEAIDALRSLLEMTAPGVEGVLYATSCRELRDLLHREWRDHPAAGLRIEQLWREGTLPGPFRTGNRSATSKHPLAELAELLDDPEAADAPFPVSDSAADRLQCVYFVGSDRVLRWTLGADGVTSDSLSITPDELRRKVGAITTAMQADPGRVDAPVGTDLAGLLRELGRVLLPSEVRDPASRPSTFLVSPDGVLRMLPFAALDVGVDAFEPLVRSTDIMLSEPRAAERGGPAGRGELIVTAPRYSAPMLRVYPGLHPLPEAQREGEALAALLPKATVLAGAAATAESVKRLWERCDVLYFATHVTRPEGVPLAGTIPLAAGSAPSDPGQEMLDPGVIAGADLRACRLVVLAGCSTGRAFHAASGESPSLGEAFLAAGARTVVATEWPVRDAEAADLLERFDRLWAAEGVSPGAALNRTVREWMIGSDGALRHPFYWAGFSITTGRVPR